MSFDEFRNSSYFILPLRIDDRKKLDLYLADPDWTECADGLKTSYFYRYASDMNSHEDKRLTVFKYKQAKTIPLYMFDSRLNKRLSVFNAECSGDHPVLESITLFVFGTGIAFLEFEIHYGHMNMDEIIEFVYLLRSLRNNETKGYLEYPEGSKSLSTVAKELFPIESGTTLCFHLEAEIKQQTNIFTMIYPELCGDGGRNDLEDEIAHWRYWLAHGYNEDFNFAPVNTPETMPDPTPGGNTDYSGRYELIFNAGPKDYWGGSQDGMACIVRDPKNFRYERLTRDYHFLYLLLLNQRFSSIAYLEEYSKPDLDLDAIRNIHNRVIDLKTRYSFRVISDDYYFQTIYSIMYKILEMDHLIDDLEDANAQLIAKQQAEQEKREAEQEKKQAEQKKREAFIGWIIGALSLLTFFSALIDFADYLGSWKKGSLLFAAISLSVNIGIVITLIIFYKRKYK